ncbi:pseudouridine synthase [Sporodiniella umbellata]|nr:pseudouridine synthase [Sporodiniella umbellata]
MRNLVLSAHCLFRHFKVKGIGLRRFCQSIDGEEIRKNKIKAALVLGFNGANYQGMQFNPGACTIESELFEALCKIGAISELNSTDPKKVQWNRCARTDRGVHAAYNVISLKILEQPELVKKLNDVLPKDIRIWGYHKTAKGFHAKNQCDSRMYEYLMPTYTLRQRKQPVLLKNLAESDRDIKILTNDSTITRYATPEDSAILEQYRVGSQPLERFKEAMSMFVGTHDFHNYTVAKGLLGRGSKRYLKDISVSEPKVIDKMEWVTIKLHGSSFMLHQIRKMISMAMLCVYTGASLGLIGRSFGSEKINIPKAPSLGLFLDRPVYHYYNEKVSKLGNRNPIDFSAYDVQTEQFKKDFIYSYIIQQEQKKNIFEDFLVNVDAHLSCDYSYFKNFPMSKINELVLAVANLAHVEKPYLENLLILKKLQLEKDPVDLEWTEAVAKCSLAEEKDRTQKGIKKSHEILKETEARVKIEEEKVRKVEVENEKYSVDQRTLTNYREDLTELLDSEGDFPKQESLKKNYETSKEDAKKKSEGMENLEMVKGLLKEADSSVLEAILELRSSPTREHMMGEGKVYFPNMAYDCLIKARELYPDLPRIPSPTEYKDEKDDTGAQYSPMQKYLWEVRQRIAELIVWCDEEVVHLMDQETALQIEVGQKLDAYNLSRRDQLSLY